MTWKKNHPARSHAFLSRLHDGELEPSERAHFESHRAHCAQCRTAAADFERALSLFRTVRSSPPPADMAARVLRKLQTRTTSAPGRSPSPLGRAFAVDWRWAGAFAAALLVLLIGAPIALRQGDKSAVRSDEPVAVRLQDKERAPASAPSSAASDELRARQLGGVPPPAAPKPDAASPRRSAPIILESRAGSVEETQKKTQRQEVNAPRDAQALQATEPKLEQSASAPEAAAQRPQVSTANRNVTAKGSTASGNNFVVDGANTQNQAQTQTQTQSQSQVQAQAPLAAANRERGGEGARDAGAFAQSPAERPIRLVIRTFDALGVAPELEAQPADPELSELRGRSYVLQLDAAGHVLDVRESLAKRSDAKALDGKLANEKEKDKDKDKARDKEVSSNALKQLRFKAGDRPRRLLVQVE